jgi:ligand-binding SRPBCC domain-containing protein
MLPRMGRAVIETFIAAPIDRVFDLALDVDAHAKSAAFSGERLVPPGRLSGALEAGDLVCFEGRHFGMRQRFCARITLVDRPNSFSDEMVEGIFSWLKHDHEFFDRDGGTLMRDTLAWKAPLGVLGRIADALFLERHMRWFVATKQRHLKAIAEGE